MSDLTFNKIAAGVLASGLAIFLLREVATEVFHAEPPEKAGYAIAVVEEPELAVERRPALGRRHRPQVFERGAQPGDRQPGLEAAALAADAGRTVGGDLQVGMLVITDQKAPGKR